MYDDDNDMAQDHMYYVSTRDLGGEPLHDQNRSLDQPQSELDQHRDAEATWAYARQGQPDDPNNDADEGQDEREEREGEAQEEPEGPAFAALVVAAAAAHGGRGLLCLPLAKFVCRVGEISSWGAQKKLWKAFSLVFVYGYRWV